MRLSGRIDWHAETNAITRVVRQKRERGDPLLDLTVSNPTAVGLEIPSGVIRALRRGAAGSYDPDPRGSRSAREALAAWLSSHKAEAVDPEALFLTSSTSEAYSWILKLLCDPGDGVVRFTPTYPLLDHLCALEGVSLRSVSLERSSQGWHLPHDLFGSDTKRAKGIIVVHPNNPTGHFLRPHETASLSDLATRYGAALIADEVFFEYGGEGWRRISTDASCLTFSLGGLSKSAALPQCKLAWIRITGPREEKRAAIEALELVADSYLPVATAIQHALRSILKHTGEIRSLIETRIEANLAIIDRAIGRTRSITRSPREGGWSAVLRIPLFGSEEDTILDLIEAGVLVHPGYFYDFTAEGWLVLSLLVRPEEMEAGMKILVSCCSERP